MQQSYYPELFTAFARLLGDPSARAASEVQPLFEAAIDTAPGTGAPHLGKALCCLYMGAAIEALDSLDLALRNGFGRGSETALYIEVGDPNADDEMLEFVLDLASTLFLRADILLALGRPQEALDQIDEVHKAGIAGLYAADVDAARAIAHVQLGQVEAAESALDDAENLDGTSERVLEARGRIAMAQDRIDLAVGIFSELLAMAPEDKDYLVLRARALIAANRVDDARSDLEAALQLIEATPMAKSETSEVSGLLKSL